MAIGLLPTPAPSRSMAPADYVSAMNKFLSALPQFVTDANGLAAALNSIAAGGVYAIPYTIDLSGTTDADPGAGKLRFSSTTQNASTALRLDLLGADNVDYTALVDTFDASTSVVKGSIRIAKQGDVTKFLVFNVSARTAPTGYRDIAVSCINSSSPNPFANGDSVILFFQRNGDVGPTGTIQRRVVSVATNSAPAPDVTLTDLYEITALSASCTLGMPAGTPTNGQSLMFRIKDNGTARTLAYNAVYRAPVEAPFPSTTVVGKWTYLGFIYNATDSKWDLVATISNM